MKQRIAVFVIILAAAFSVAARQAKDNKTTATAADAAAPTVVTPPAEAQLEVARLIARLNADASKMQSAQATYTEAAKDQKDAQEAFLAVLEAARKALPKASPGHHWQEAVNEKTFQLTFSQVEDPKPAPDKAK
jgi:hypothetical protein